MNVREQEQRCISGILTLTMQEQSKEDNRGTKSSKHYGYNFIYLLEAWCMKFVHSRGRGPSARTADQEPSVGHL